MAHFLENHCDGSGPHGGPHEVRTRPIGGSGNVILCRSCWARENRYCYERGRETGAPENWPQQAWEAAEVYAKEEKEDTSNVN